MSKILIVGTGLAGSVMAERLARAGHHIFIIDKRDHIGGNAHDKLNEHGILTHVYGPHVFHTNDNDIENYVKLFSSWRNFEYKALANVDGKLCPIPINLTTINTLYNLQLTNNELEIFLNNVRIKKQRIENSRDVIESKCGIELCDKFFAGYTLKQWGLRLEELDQSVAARIPIRINNDDRYFTDKFQAVPCNGYTDFFKSLLDHKNINVELCIKFEDVKTIKRDLTIYTGPIDEYFDHKFGKLQYRSLNFEHEHISSSTLVQKSVAYNFPSLDVKYTRQTEHRWMTGQKSHITTITREFPTGEGDPYYPVPRKLNDDLYNMYRELSESESNTIFIGRLAEYKYYNMDQIVGRALSQSAKLI